MREFNRGIWSETFNWPAEWRPYVTTQLVVRKESIEVFAFLFIDGKRIRVDWELNIETLPENDYIDCLENGEYLAKELKSFIDSEIENGAVDRVAAHG